MLRPNFIKDWVYTHTKMLKNMMRYNEYFDSTRTIEMRRRFYRFFPEGNIDNLVDSSNRQYSFEP